jgi:hypothetical protein
MAGINLRNNFPRCHHYGRGYCKNFKRINKKLQEENDALKNEIKSSIVEPK